MCSEETKRKISRANKGKKRSEEFRKRMSTIKMGNVPGNKGKHHTEEARRKMSEAAKNRGPMNEETKKKLSLLWKGKQRPELCGRVPWNKGKVGVYSKETLEKMSKNRRGILHTEETKRKIQEASRKRGISKETREKIANSRRGRKLSEETKKKLSESHSGKIPWNKGIKGERHLSAETKAKLSEIRKKSPKVQAHIKRLHENMTFRSKGENELFLFICEIYKGRIIRNDKKTLNGFELDVVLPDLKIAFEYNGNYWHSRINTRDRDIWKIIECHKLGIDLFDVWDDDWKNKNEETRERVFGAIYRKKSYDF